MLKGIIIDDEINSVELLEHLINDNCPDIDIIAAETSPKKGIELIEKHKPDVVFLDIEMTDELLELLSHLSFHVIFITAYDNYAIKAFKYNTIDYLLKPIIVGELTAAVDKLVARTHSSNTIDVSVQKFLETFRTVQNQSKLAINALNEIVYIDVNNIIRLESDSNYTNVILIDGKKIISSKTLKEYETVLDSGVFFRTHKTYIINLNHVQKYIKTDGGYIVTKDNFQVPVSREKRTALLDVLAKR